MKKTIFSILSIVVLLATAFTFTSCGDNSDEPDDGDNTLLGIDVPVVVTTTKAGVKLFEGDKATVKFERYLGGISKADAIFTSIQFMDKMPALAIEIPALDYTYDEKSKVTSFSGTDITPTYKGAPMDMYQITDFTATVNDKTNTVTGSFVCMGMTVTFESKK